MDYLLKPIEKADLTSAVNKAALRLKDHSVDRMDALISTFRQYMDAGKKIALPTGDGLSFIDVDQIVRCESDSNYTFVHLAKGEKNINHENTEASGRVADELPVLQSASISSG